MVDKNVRIQVLRDTLGSVGPSGLLGICGVVTSTILRGPDARPRRRTFELPDAAAVVALYEKYYRHFGLCVVVCVGVGFSRCAVTFLIMDGAWFATTVDMMSARDRASVRMTRTCHPKPRVYVGL